MFGLNDDPKTRIVYLSYFIISHIILKNIFMYTQMPNTILKTNGQSKEPENKSSDS